MVPLGTPMPEFALPDTVSGRLVRSSEFAGTSGLVVMFICNHCPFVKHVRAQLAALGRDYAGRMPIVAISSNDVAAHPEDAPDLMKVEALEAGYVFPYCFDESQQVAMAFGAACTPDFFLYGSDGRLAYRGQLDESRPPSKGYPPIEVTGRDLRAAMDAVLAGTRVPEPQRASLGCNIKWKPGNEPRL
jgi:thiol-disulfide isomerase/thioredoxin